MEDNLTKIKSFKGSKFPLFRNFSEYKVGAILDSLIFHMQQENLLGAKKGTLDFGRSTDLYPSLRVIGEEGKFGLFVDYHTSDDMACRKKEERFFNKGKLSCFCHMSDSCSNETKNQLISILSKTFRKFGLYYVS